MDGGIRINDLKSDSCVQTNTAANFSKNKNICKYITIALFVFIRTDLVCPDEEWFMSIINSLGWNNFKDFICTPNYLGYGSFYWMLYGLLNNILIIRLFSWLCLLTVTFCIFYILKYMLHESWKVLLLSTISYLMIPLAWFTGKIIGPELLGNALGTLGITLFINFTKKVNNGKMVYYILGGILIGISSGIKLYNLIFFVFCGFYSLFSVILDNWISIKKCIILLINTFLGVIIGFLMANPYMLITLEMFKANLGNSQISFKTNNLFQCLFEKKIEWDLVNSSGIGHSIISCLAFLFLIFMVLFNNRKRNAVSLSAVLTSLVLIICISWFDNYYGWYFLPMVFFIPLIIYESKLFIIIFCINLIFIFPDLKYQLVSKYDQYVNVNNQNEINDFVNSYYEKMPGYDYYTFIDVGLNDIKMNRSYLFEEDYNQLIFISERARNNEVIDDLLLETYNNIENRFGYYLVEENESLGIKVIASLKCIK